MCVLHTKLKNTIEGCPVDIIGIMKKLVFIILGLLMAVQLSAQILKERRVYYLDCSYSMVQYNIWNKVRENLVSAIDNINDETIESALSSVICKNNESWANNDSLQVILLKQKRVASLNERITLPTCSSIIVNLDNSSATKIGEIPVLESLSNMSRFSLCNVNGKLAVKVADAKKYAYAFAVVHGRGEGREKIVSTQQLCLSDTAMYDCYCSDEAFAKAYKSYK